MNISTYIIVVSCQAASVWSWNKFTPSISNSVHIRQNLQLNWKLITKATSINYSHIHKSTLFVIHALIQNTTPLPRWLALHQRRSSRSGRCAKVEVQSTDTHRRCVYAGGACRRCGYCVQTLQALRADAACRRCRHCVYKLRTMRVGLRFGMRAMRTVRAGVACRNVVYLNRHPHPLHAAARRLCFSL